MSRIPMAARKRPRRPGAPPPPLTTRWRTEKIKAAAPVVFQPEWRVGTCPDCGGPLLDSEYWNREEGHRLYRECWNRLGTAPTCTYRVRTGPASAFLLECERLEDQRLEAQRLEAV